MSNVNKVESLDRPTNATLAILIAWLRMIFSIFLNKGPGTDPGSLPTTGFPQWFHGLCHMLQIKGKLYLRAIFAPKGKSKCFCI